MVYNTLIVDTELRDDLVQRSYRVEQHEFCIKFTSKNAKMLRTSVSSFFDMLLLAVRTLEKFGK